MEVRLISLPTGFSAEDAPSIRLLKTWLEWRSANEQDTVKRNILSWPLFFAFGGNSDKNVNRARVDSGKKCMPYGKPLADM